MATTSKTPMSKDHKEALAVGRAEGRSVRAYLEALDSSRPKRGRKRTKDSINSRLAKIDAELEAADALKRLQLTQERLDLVEELGTMDTGVDISELEAEFTRVAKGYAARKGISYAAFRQIGVPAAVLKKAGIGRAA
ncbi:MAG: hypothetical protein OEY41_13970 [Acidimicrobiia bacterium]|nr:hypothetical protein [Acidimicrobiia bacterium]MDH5291096.1 hypothetical protein [Acidimicrobiia bacterium]